jgi:hypothetical protein
VWDRTLGSLATEFRQIRDREENIPEREYDRHISRRSLFGKSISMTHANVSYYAWYCVYE